MTKLKEIINESDSYYTWQLRAEDYTCTFTTTFIQEAFKRMQKQSEERNKEKISLFLLKKEGWLEFSNSDIYNNSQK